MSPYQPAAVVELKPHVSVPAALKGLLQQPLTLIAQQPELIADLCGARVSALSPRSVVAPICRKGRNL